jgi:NTP pyrophosphatase (non-canonical NTP hydrolase)
MIDLSTVLIRIKEFRDERDWSQFHNSKDLAIALSIEATELLELFLWKSAEDFDQSKLKAELADVFIYSLLIADKHGFDIQQIIQEKLNDNALKYPVEKAKGVAKKYNEL